MCVAGLFACVVACCCHVHSVSVWLIMCVLFVCVLLLLRCVLMFVVWMWLRVDDGC